jgi:MFS family permease
MKQVQTVDAPVREHTGLFYGWWIVAIGCILDAVKGGTFNSGFSLYFLPILNELQLSRAATSLPFSLAKLEAAVEGPLVGFLIDRFDLRVMLVLGTTLAGLGFVLLSYTHSYVLFLVVFMGLLTMGFQAGFNHATMAAVNHWFLRKRGLAMSIVQTGQAIGGVVIFPLVALAVLNLGWRQAAFLSGIGVLALVPLVLLVRRSPESMGLLPDGEPRALHNPSAVVTRRVRRLRESEEFTAREALRTPAFWLMAAFHGLRNVPHAGVSVHLVPLLVWKGLDEHTAAFFVGLAAFSAVIVRPLTGWLVKTEDRRPGSHARGVGSCRVDVQQWCPLAYGFLRHLVFVRRWRQFGDVGAGRGLFRPQPFCLDSRLDRDDSEPCRHASSGIHRLDLRPDAELRLCSHPIHRHLRPGWPGIVASAPSQTATGAGGPRQSSARHPTITALSLCRRCRKFERRTDHSPAAAT